MMDARGWRESGVKVLLGRGTRGRCSLVFVGGETLFGRLFRVVGDSNWIVVNAGM